MMNEFVLNEKILQVISVEEKIFSIVQIQESLEIKVPKSSIKQSLLELLKQEKVRNYGSFWKKSCAISNILKKEKNEKNIPNVDLYIKCPSCNVRLDITEDLLGAMVYCPVCNTTFQIPSSLPD